MFREGGFLIRTCRRRKSYEAFHSRLARADIHALIPGSFLATLIERYREEHPGIDVEIAESTACDSVMQLRANRLDLTFVAGSPEFPDCHARRIWSERLLAVLPTDQLLAGQPSLTWSDLAGKTFLGRYVEPGRSLAAFHSRSSHCGTLSVL